jgi:hypothetical protein
MLELLRLSVVRYAPNTFYRFKAGAVAEKKHVPLLDLFRQSRAETRA